jgi:hypothetical protein
MLLIVGTICFDTGTVQLLIEGAIDDEDRSRLIDYLASCRKIGLNIISLGYPGPNSAENRSAVEEIAASAGASVDSASIDAGVDSCRSEPRPETDGRDLSMTNQFEFRRTGPPPKCWG